ncbi:MAG: class I SAM-dependent methyltransferase [Actinobacteria bacterium]|nr:MAG: class I SAM-dependent methyltransferase [Actinomycetota bacterium]
MTTLALEACPACGARDAEAAELGLRRCAACGMVYAPAYADPGEVFVEGYFEGGAGSYGIDTAHPRFQAFMAEVCARRCAFIESETPVGSLLDVGGAEPMPEAAQLARSRAPGADVRTGLSQDVGFVERSFDVVCAFHVLEHMPNARTFLRGLARFARPGGLVVVETPNYASRLRRVQGERWLHLRPLEHLVHFTPDTMRAAFAGAGLEPLRVTTPTWIVAEHTRDELAAELALARVPRALAPLVERMYRRRGVGAVVLAAGRVDG